MLRGVIAIELRKKGEPHGWYLRSLGPGVRVIFVKSLYSDVLWLFPEICLRIHGLIHLKETVFHVSLKSKSKADFV